MSTIELRAVVERATRRDADAWEELYRYAYRRLYSYCRRRLYDDQAAEDAVSETMTRALRTIDGFSWRGSGFDGWLYGIARNVVYEFGRSRRRHAGGIDADQRPATDRTPEEHLVAVDESDAVRSAFNRLDDDERELLELRIHAGLSSEAAGRILGKQPGAVRMAQARALQRLRVMLEQVHHAH